MPTAPSYGLERVAPAPIPGARLTAVPSPDTFGAGAGEKLAKVGAEIVDQARFEADQTAVFEARRKDVDWERTALYDPESGAYAKRGKDAMGVPEQVLSDYDKHVAETMQTLSTQRQRAAYERASAARREQIGVGLSKHVATETEKYLVNSYSADIDSMSDRAARDPRLASGELAIAEARTIDFYKSRGANDTMIADKLQAVRSKIHGSIISSLAASGAIGDAQAWLQNNRERIDPDTVTKLEQHLRPMADQARGAAIADDVDAKLGPGATFDQASELIKRAAGDNPNARKVAQAEWEHRQSARATLAERANKQNEDNVDAQLSKYYAAGRTPPIAQVQALPAFQALDGSRQLQVIDKVRSIGRSLRAEAERDDKLDPVAYWNALQNIDTMSGSDIAAARGLPRSTKIALMNEKLKRDAGQENDIPGLQQANRIFETTFLGALNKKTRTDLNDAEKQRLGELNRTYEEQLRQAAQGLPKGRLNSGEMQQIADSLLIQGRFEGTGALFGLLPDKRGFRGEALPGSTFTPIEASRVEDIPLSIRRAAAKELERAGVTVTPERVRLFYNEQIRNRTMGAPTPGYTETQGGAAMGRGR